MCRPGYGRIKAEPTVYLVPPVAVTLSSLCSLFFCCEAFVCDVVDVETAAGTVVMVVATVAAAEAGTIVVFDDDEGVDIDDRSTMMIVSDTDTMMIFKLFILCNDRVTDDFQARRLSLTGGTGTRFRTATTVRLVDATRFLTRVIIRVLLLMIHSGQQNTSV